MTGEEPLEDAAAAAAAGSERNGRDSKPGEAWTGARPQRGFKAEVKMCHAPAMTATNTRTPVQQAGGGEE